MSEQEIKKLEKGLALPIMESFYTIQGEGFYSGCVAYFIRTAGCSVGCHWCDVKESWDSRLYPLQDVEKIVEKAVSVPSKMVVVTGGEPLMWNLNPMTDLLREKKIRRHIETSGAFELSGQWDWICLSPKKLALPKNSVLEKANELKVVVYNNNDFLFAQQMAEKVGENCMLYLQPEWSKKDQVIPKIVEFVKEKPQWQMSLQTHKYMNVP